MPDIYSLGSNLSADYDTPQVIEKFLTDCDEGEVYAFLEDDGVYSIGRRCGMQYEQIACHVRAQYVNAIVDLLNSSGVETEREEVVTIALYPQCCARAGEAVLAGDFVGRHDSDDFDVYTGTRDELRGLAEAYQKQVGAGGAHMRKSGSSILAVLDVDSSPRKH